MAKTATLNVKIADREEVKAAIKALTDEIDALRAVIQQLAPDVYDDGVHWVNGGEIVADSDLMRRALGNQEEYDRG